MKEDITKPIVIYCDNISDVNISKNSMMHTKKKHMEIKYNYLRELVQDKKVMLEYLYTKEKISDIFTMALPKEAHEYLRDKLGVIPLSDAN